MLILKNRIFCNIYVRIKRIESENFRSLVFPSSGIDFDSSFTVCVGKNNSGKSNLVKFLRELKQNHVPLNRTYVLQRANWYNNEIGVDCPLKLKIL